MTTTLPLLLTILLSFTAVCIVAKNVQPKCDSAPLHILFEKYYEGHPFRNVNLGRNSSHWNIRKYKLEFNNMTDYQVRRQVGSGTFSNVFKTTHLPTGAQVVFKHLVDSTENMIKKEVRIMKEVGDLPNIIPIQDVLKDNTDEGEMTGLVFEFFKAKYYKDLFPTLSKHEIKVFIYETLRTLHHAHSRGIVHRDIKPLNVLMNAESLETRVIDWGHSDYYLPGKRSSIYVSSLHFKSPELLLGYEFHDYSLDIWSTGCMLAEMAFLKTPFFAANKYTPLPSDSSTDNNETAIKMERFSQQLDAIAQVMGTLPLKQYASKFQNEMEMSQLDGVGDYKKVSLSTLINEKNAHLVDDQLINLLEKMLTYDHTKRITAEDALAHKYFDEVRSESNSQSESSTLAGLRKIARIFTQSK